MIKRFGNDDIPLRSFELDPENDDPNEFDDEAIVQYLNYDVIPYLNDTSNDDFQQVSRELSEVWYHNLFPNLGLQVRSPHNHLWAVGGWPSTTILNDIKAEWNMYLCNYLVSKIRQLPRLEELNIGFGGTFLSPLDQLARLLRIDDHPELSVLKHVSVYVQLPAYFPDLQML